MSYCTGTIIYINTGETNTGFVDNFAIDFLENVKIDSNNDNFVNSNGAVNLDNSPIFVDISTSFFKSYVEELYSKGIISGYKNENGGKETLTGIEFRPQNLITRIEYLKMILGGIGENNGTDMNKTPFDDVQANTWEARVLNRAVELGLVNTNNKKFRPTDYITKEEIMKISMLALNIEIKGVTKSSYSDVNGWSMKYIEKARELEIIESENKMFGPKDNITREETAKIVSKIMKLKK